MSPHCHASSRSGRLGRIAADRPGNANTTDPGRLVYYPFGEGSGNGLIDHSANGLDGLLGGGVAAQRPAWLQIHRE